jgi:hypothetical protein
METAMDSVDLGLRITDRDPHLLPTDNPRELARRAELYREQSERFMYSIPRTTLETLRDRFPGDRETYKKIRELCNKILSCRAYEDLPYITHDRLASEYTQARITVGKEEAREAAIELVSVLNTINMRRKATEGKASSYELREQVNNLHDAILGSSQQA